MKKMIGQSPPHTPPLHTTPHTSMLVPEWLCLCRHAPLPMGMLWWWWSCLSRSAPPCPPDAQLQLTGGTPNVWHFCDAHLRGPTVNKIMMVIIMVIHTTSTTATTTAIKSDYYYPTDTTYNHDNSHNHNHYWSNIWWQTQFPNMLINLKQIHKTI